MTKLQRDAQASLTKRLLEFSLGIYDKSPAENQRNMFSCIMDIYLRALSFEQLQDTESVLLAAINGNGEKQT